MQFFMRKNKGAISVFLTLILLPMVIFSGMVVDVSRLYAAKTVISGAGDLTMNAALSRYDNKLKNEYGLLAMADTPDSPAAKEMLQGYFKESCGIGIAGEKENLHSMFQMELGEDGVKASGVKGSSLAQTDVLKQQIMEYMKIRGPVYIITDILEKLQKLPLKNMKEKQKYVKNKTEFGKALKELGEPLKKAKEEVEKHINVVSGVADFSAAESNILDDYKEGVVFWLAARSLENYLQGYTPVPGMRSGQIDNEGFRKLLAGAVVWDENNETFDYTVYADMVASIALYQSKDSLKSDVTLDNGFTWDEIEAFQNIDQTIIKSIRVMDRIHNKKAEEFESTVESYIQQAKEIENTAEEGTKALNEVLSVWEKKVKPKKENCEESKSELASLGEDTSELDEELEELDIKEEDVKSLLDCLEFNKETAQTFEQYGEELKKLPQKLDAIYISGEEGAYLIDEGAQGGLDKFWNEHSDVLKSDYMSFVFQDAEKETFYQDILKKIDEESDDNGAKAKKKQKKKEAKNADRSYGDLLSSLENFANNKNLKEFEGITYPNDFPTGIAGAAPDSGSGKGWKAIKTDDEDVVNKLTKEDGFTSKFSEFLKGLDAISGKTLEKAYLMEYMTEMFNCLTTKEGEKSLSENALDSHYITNGEIEYILYGKENTSANLTQAVSILYGIRLAINGIYVFCDKKLNAEATALADSIAAATGQLWLYPIIKYGYLCCTAITYSSQDVLSLTQGEEVAVWRGKEDIKMSYKEYMKLFILISLLDDSSENRLLARTGDCIQLNTGKKLKDKYTMLTIEADVKVSTVFLPAVPEFLGKKNFFSDGKKVIRYKSIMAY